jgi:hypothetical protein
MEVLASEGGLRRGYGGLQTCGVTQAWGTAIALDLLLVSLRDFVQRQEQRVH